MKILGRSDPAGGYNYTLNGGVIRESIPGETIECVGTGLIIFSEHKLTLAEAREKFKHMWDDYELIRRPGFDIIFCS